LRTAAEGLRVEEYIYKGDRMTDKRFRAGNCMAVRRVDGKCIRGKNGNMLVNFNGTKVVVVARQLRKLNKEKGK
jgi:hypothetical protein